MSLEPYPMICIPITIEILPSKTPPMKHPFASLSFVDPLPHTLSLVSCLVSFFKPRFLGMFPLVRSGEASQMVNVSAGSSPRAMLVPWCLFWRRSHHRHHHYHHRGLFPSLLLFLSLHLFLLFSSFLSSFFPSFLSLSLSLASAVIPRSSFSSLHSSSLPRTYFLVFSVSSSPPHLPSFPFPSFLSPSYLLPISPLFYHPLSHSLRLRLRLR